MISLCPSWWRGAGDTSTSLCSAFRQVGGGQRAFLVSTASQLSSAQSNPHAKVAYSATLCKLCKDDYKLAHFFLQRMPPMFQALF